MIIINNEFEKAQQAKLSGLTLVLIQTRIKLKNRPDEHVCRVFEITVTLIKTYNSDWKTFF